MYRAKHAVSTFSEKDIDQFIDIIQLDLSIAGLSTSA